MKLILPPGLLKNSQYHILHGCKKKEKEEKILYVLGNIKWLKVYNLRMLMPKCKET